MRKYPLSVIRYPLISFSGIFLLVTLTGCEAFVRKFTRKPKKDENKTVEMVLTPQEYKAPLISKEELYRRYFIFWQSWHDELINALSFESSVKKQMDCLTEAVKSLMSIRDLLNNKKRIELDGYLKQISDLESSLKQDVYGNDINKHRTTAENIQRGIWHDFSYSEVKDSLL